MSHHRRRRARRDVRCTLCTPHRHGNAGWDQRHSDRRLTVSGMEQQHSRPWSPSSRPSFIPTAAAYISMTRSGRSTSDSGGRPHLKTQPSFVTSAEISTQSWR